MPCLGWRIAFWSRIILCSVQKISCSGCSGNAVQRLENASRIMPRPAQRREILSDSLMTSLFSGNPCGGPRPLHRAARGPPPPPLRGGGCWARSLVPVHPLAALVALLRFDGERCDRARFEALDRDRLAGLLAIAVGAVFDARERRLDLGDELALAVARPQFDGAIGLRGGAVGEVGMVLVLILEMLEGLLGLLENILLPRQQFLSEIVPLAFVHERLFVGRPIGFNPLHAL